MTNTTPTIEPIFSKLAGDPDMSELVDLFVDEIPSRLAALESHFAAGDMTKLCQTAHQIKGAAGSYGFTAVTPFAANLEFAAKANEPEDRVREALEELLATCRRIRSGVPE
jgi:HPt (histidine-containing phosphotransfer) domain-containing protein